MITELIGFLSETKYVKPIWYQEHMHAAAWNDKQEQAHFLHLLANLVWQHEAQPNDTSCWQKATYAALQGPNVLLLHPTKIEAGTIMHPLGLFMQGGVRNFLSQNCRYIHTVHMYN